MKPSLTLFAVAMAGLAAIVPIQPVRGEGCPPNSAPVETVSEKDTIIHCRCVSGFENREGVCVRVKDAKFPPAAANLVNIMDRVTKELNRPKGGYHKGLKPRLVCNLFFQGVGKELTKLGLPADRGAWKKGLIAVQIKGEIEADKTAWNELKEGDVQERANRGIIVVAVSRDHVAIAFPVPPGTQFSAKEPLFRDGNEHGPENQADRRLHASSWGAVPARNMFGYEYGDKEKKELKSPRFYVWTPSESSASALSHYKRQIVPR
ncbi:MAG: hypothetical protein PHC90_13805 [Syntrophorhabdaceae bacterium]|nr:hypothetical protein [Syntrophorhabdaceae bacterium]